VANSYGRCSTKKLKVALFSMSSKNEFIIERILFFGINTNRVKQSRVNKICIYNLNRNVNIVPVRWSLQHQQIWMINLNRNTGRTEFPLKRDRRLEAWNGEKLLRCEWGFPNSQLQCRKKIRWKDVHFNSILMTYLQRNSHYTKLCK
jgi:hypothetical protein